MLLVCKQNAMPVLRNIGKYSAVVLCGILGCVAAIIQLLFYAATHLFAKYMGLTLRARMIVGSVVVFGIIVLIASPKSKNCGETDFYRPHVGNALSKYAGALPETRVDNSRRPYSNNALSQYAGTTRGASAISQPQVTVASGSNPYTRSGSFVGYSPNDISAEYLGTYNPHYEAYRPNGSYFGGWKPNTNMVQSVDLDRTGKIDLQRMWEIDRKISRYYTQKRLSDLETERAVLQAENKMREANRQLHELEIDQITGTTKAQRDFANQHNLEQMHPGSGSSWGAGYGLSGDSELYKDRSSGDSYLLKPDGSAYRLYDDGSLYKVK